MLKKITTILFVAITASNGFAGKDKTTEASLREEIEALKAQVAEMRDQQNKLAENHAKYSDEIIPVPEEEVAVPMNQGKISNFLFSTLYKGAKPMGMLSGAQFPLGILRQRNVYNDYSLTFSGYLQANAQYWHGSNINITPVGSKTNYQSGKGVYISTASLYTAANIDRYVTGTLVISGNETADSLKIKNAFVVFGNLDEYPIYATIGKNRIALGSFSGGGPWTGSLTQMLFRPGDTTNASIAYYGHGLSTNVSIFQTDEQSTDLSYAAFYQNKLGDLNYGINGGYVYNVNGTGQKSFDRATASGQRIGAINFDLSLNYDIFGLGSGFAQTTNKWVTTNDGYAGAWYLQAWVSPSILGEPTNINLSYHSAYNTSKIPVSLTGSTVSGYKTDGTSVNRMIITSIARPFLTDNVLVGLEYVYMHMYNHQHSNAYTLNISAYF